MNECAELILINFLFCLFVETECGTDDFEWFVQSWRKSESSCTKVFRTRAKPGPQSIENNNKKRDVNTEYRGQRAAELIINCVNLKRAKYKQTKQKEGWLRRRRIRSGRTRTIVLRRLNTFSMNLRMKEERGGFTNGWLHRKRKGERERATSYRHFCLFLFTYLSNST